jgi:DNA-binding NarL/FixJ family response regulator
VSEVLANAVRHARASAITVVLCHRDGVLRAMVRDDGRGGADPAGGTGLRGIERRPPTNTDEGLQAALTARREIPALPVLILSQHVEQLYARELLADGAGAIGYLLKDRVFNADQFIDAVHRVAAGGTVIDPDVIAKLLAPARTGTGRLSSLTPRERDVLAEMAQGRSNAAIGQKLFLSESAVGKHIASIFGKLDLVQSDDDNRRVLAVLAYLNA